MRDALAAMGADPGRANPLLPADLVIDHSVQVDRFGGPDAFDINALLEFQRNRERYMLLRWGQTAFRNFRVVPPDTGIVHQVNLEYLASVVFREPTGAAYPDSLVGTDSHTTMINGLGVLGWGVGGIEAEACMLGQPISMLLPPVVGFKLHGRLPEGCTATDLVLTVTQMLRKKGVVGKFVEFYGAGLSALSLADRATVANMAPEYGATMGFFPVDQETLEYLKFTNRDRRPGRPGRSLHQGTRAVPHRRHARPGFADTLELDLATVMPSMAGPKRPQDRVELPDVKKNFHAAFGPQTSACRPDRRPRRHARKRRGGDRGHHQLHQYLQSLRDAGRRPGGEEGRGARAQVEAVGEDQPGARLQGGDRLLSRSRPARRTWKSSISTWWASAAPPASATAVRCPKPVAQAVQKENLVVAAVLSGNRNFEGRINPLVKANYLASPPLVVAYALAGTMDIDLTTDPLGEDPAGQPVYLRDIWPTNEEVRSHRARLHQPGDVRARIRPGLRRRHQLADPAGAHRRHLPVGRHLHLHQEAALLRQHGGPRRAAIADLHGMRVLALLGDSVTTDHISPAGSIPKDSPAGRYLMAQGVQPADFNSYGARRGNHEVMVRGTLANIRLRNQLAPGTEGGWTRHLPDGEQMSIYDAVREIPAGRRAAADSRGQGIRLRLLARLGRQGRAAAGRPRGDRRELRAHSPHQPGGHGRAAAAIPAGGKRRQPRADRQGDVPHRRHGRRTEWRRAPPGCAPWPMTAPK